MQIREKNDLGLKIFTLLIRLIGKRGGAIAFIFASNSSRERIIGGRSSSEYSIKFLISSAKEWASSNFIDSSSFSCFSISSFCSFLFFLPMSHKATLMNYMNAREAKTIIQLRRADSKERRNVHPGKETSFDSFNIESYIYN